jgi:hypothetical protein
VQVVGAWLAAAAIALNALWPLIANARPQAVALVPVCTVEGITHYIEVPGGKSPLDESSAKQHEHCSFCFVGERLALPSHFEPLHFADSRTFAVPSQDSSSVTNRSVFIPAARAPPGSPLVREKPKTKESHEAASASGRHRDGAVAADHRAGVMRVGVLHS